MKHQIAGRKLGRTTSHRNAMFRNMLASFFEHEKIETTTVKAKELRPMAEKLITLGKRGDLHARRRVLRLIPDIKVVHKLFNEIASRFESRQGGYTRIIRTGYRAGDKAPMSIIELISEETVPVKKKGKKKKAPAKAKPEVKSEVVEATSSEKKKQSKDLPRENDAPENKSTDKAGEKSPEEQKKFSSTPTAMSDPEKESGRDELESDAGSGDESKASTQETA